MKKKFLHIAITILVLSLSSAALQEPKPTNEQTEEIKKQNEKAKQANALTLQAMDAMNAGKWKDAVPLLQQLAAMYPDNWQYYSGLGDCFLHTSQFDKAVESYQKGIDAAQSITTPDPKKPITDPEKRKSGLTRMLNNQGNAYVGMHKNDKAIAAFTKATVIDPNSALAFYDLCTVKFNSKSPREALPVCEKALDMNPDKPNAYYMKGFLLAERRTTDEQGKTTAPPGAAEALNKYLELAPNGTYAQQARELLKSIGH